MKMKLNKIISLPLEDSFFSNLRGFSIEGMYVILTYLKTISYNDSYYSADDIMYDYAEDYIDDVLHDYRMTLEELEKITFIIRLSNNRIVYRKF